MKLHDLRPAEGSRTARTRVGRGIAAGKGKTAGRGTKGQKARTGHHAVAPWFEGGQTPIHVRVPKLRGFKNRFRIEYEIVNIGRISALAETGVLDIPETDGAATKAAPITVTPDILAAAGLIRTLNKPVKVLGTGDVTKALFVVADAFTKTAKAKIEAAGGTATVLEFPIAGDEAYGVDTLISAGPASDAGSEA
jgi:large subunit ribosomal protein L15